jgi:hypothetical protein
MEQKGEGKVLILGLIVVLSVVFLALGQEGDESDWWEYYFDDLEWSVPVYRGAIIGPPEIEDWEPNGVGIGDYNEDGRLDLVVSNYNEGYVLVDGEIHGRLTVLLGNEQGGFTLLERDTFEYSIESYEYWLAGDILSEDFNEDGHLDLGFTMNGEIIVLYGDGGGGFTDPLTLDSGGYLTWGVVACDFNEDGHADIACADGEQRVIAIFLGDGEGGFSSPVLHPTRMSPWKLAPADFDEDGHVDLATVEGRETETSPIIGASLFLGKGDGDFEAPLAIAVSEQPVNVAGDDFDGDGHQDLVFLYPHRSSLDVVLGNGDGSFQEPIEYPLPKYNPFYLDTGDFDADGRSDVVIGFWSGVQSRLLLSDGKGGFSRTSDFWAGTASAGITATDIDKDGHLDIVNFSKRLVFIAKGDGQGHLGATWFRPSPEPPPSGFTWNRIGSKEVGDFNEDGLMDFVDPDWDGDSIELFLGNEEGGIVEAPASPFYVGEDPEDIVAGDFNEDGHMDAATAVDNDIVVLLGNGQGGFGAPANFAAGGEPWSLDKGDFNEDGHLDIVTANWWSDDVSCLLGDGKGRFTIAPGSPIASEKLNPKSIAVGDFNNDTQLDLITANGGEWDGSLALLLGDGSGTFSDPAFFYVGGDPFAVVTGDFNGDGNLDVVIGAFHSTRTVVLGDGRGGFLYMAVFSDWQELYRPLVVRDYDDDGDLDFHSRITFLNTMEGYPGEGK